MCMYNTCDDDRFEVIAKAKEELHKLEEKIRKEEEGE